jgi:hypothetical protein
MSPNEAAHTASRGLLDHGGTLSSFSWDMLEGIRTFEAAKDVFLMKPTWLLVETQICLMHTETRHYGEP